MSYLLWNYVDASQARIWLTKQLLRQTAFNLRKADVNESFKISCFWDTENEFTFTGKLWAAVALALISAVFAQWLIRHGLRSGREVRFARLDTGETSHLIPLAAVEAGARERAHTFPTSRRKAQTMRPRPSRGEGFSEWRMAEWERADRWRWWTNRAATSKDKGCGPTRSGGRDRAPRL